MTKKQLKTVIWMSLLPYCAILLPLIDSSYTWQMFLKTTKANSSECVFFRTLGNIYNSYIGKLGFLLVFLIVLVVLNEFNDLEFSNKNDSFIVRVFQPFQNRIKFSITWLGLCILCWYKLLVGLDIQNAIDLIMSNNVFLILFFFDNEKNAKDILQKRELDDIKKNMNIYATLAILSFVLFTVVNAIKQFFFRIYVVSKNDIFSLLFYRNKLISFLFDLVSNVGFGAYVILASSLLVNYCILYFLLKSDFLKEIMNN